MDQLKEKIEEVIKKVTNDKSIARDFNKNPVKVVEKIVGTDLDDDVILKIVDGVKAKISINSTKSLVDNIKSIFKKGK